MVIISPILCTGPEYNGQINGDLREEMIHFVDTIFNDKEFLMPTDDSIEALEIIEGILKSIELGEPVKLDKRRRI